MTSRKKHVWIFILCIVALAVLIVFKPSYGWRLRSWLGSQIWFDSQNNGRADDETAAVSAAQNEVLQAQLAMLQNVAAQLPQNPHDDIRAMVYARYPFGFKNEILVNAGSGRDVAAGHAVTFQGIFIGKVSKVFSDSAIIQTVFDSDFKTPVRVGVGSASSTGLTKTYDALFVGGALPRIISLAKDAPIAEGDIVYTAAPGFPYGLPVAAIAATSTSADKLFQEASLNVAYDMNEVQTVLIAR